MMNDRPVIILATRNAHKLDEIIRILDISGLSFLSMQDAGIMEQIPETGNSFEENALLKARWVHQQTGLPAIADDSGLEVDALHGEPGIYSSRFAGPDANYEQNNRLLLEKLKDVPPEARTGRFRCVAAYVDRKTTEYFEGTVEGRIGFEPKGNRGFGYDPLFIPAGFDHTFAELGEEIKNQFSHRAKAFRQLAIFLRKYYQL